MPDPYEVDDEGRPVAEAREDEESKSEDAPTPAEADPVDDAEQTAEADLIAGTEPVAESAASAEPTAEEAAMRRQIETTLRFMRLQTAVGFIVIVALIIFMSSIRNVLVLVLIIFTFSSLGAYWWLARNLNSRLRGAAPRR